MPELPETETIARDLDLELRGARISEVSVRRRDVLRGTSPSQFVRRVTGALVAVVWRRAKIVVLDLGTADRIAVQPRFTGSLLIETLFSLDGLGLLSYESVIRRDYPVVLGTLYLFTLIGLVTKLVSDLCYVWVDPRVKFD